MNGLSQHAQHAQRTARVAAFAGLSSIGKRAFAIACAHPNANPKAIAAALGASDSDEVAVVKALRITEVRA